MNISDFYANEYTNSALYQSFRTIASVVDGFKPSSRKVFHTVDKKNIISEYKVANLASDVSSFTEFIHGSVSLEGVIVGMAQDFNNNYPLLAAEGSFGNRLNHSAASSRYIFTKKSSVFDKFFNETDKQLVEYREFEGKSIEPFFYVPIVPLLLLNGSSGIGNGYAQKILPRKLEDILSAINNLLNKKKVSKICPWFNGFNGKVLQLESGKVEIQGLIKNEGTLITITELPFSYELVWYLNELDKLVEKGIIKEYRDLSESTSYKFEIKCTRDFSKQTEYEILDQLKLIDRLTENFTCVSEKDSIVEFSNEIELLEAFIKIRKEFYIKRKAHLLKTYEKDLLILENKINFINEINNETIILAKKSKIAIEDILTTKAYDLLEGDFEYLLSMRLDSLTTDKLEKLTAKQKELTVKVENLKKSTAESLWEADLTLLS